MSTLHNQLAVAESEDVARGIRLLLRTPLLTQGIDPDAFDLVRRRQQPLTAWFDHHCGWTLLVEPRLGYARLVKIGTVHDASRPARRLRSGRAPFDRRRYTLLCLVAAELLDTPVTTTGLLAERVSQTCASDDVLADFDTSKRSERMAFVDALVLLEHLGAVEVLDGSSDAFVDAGSAKVLYRVNTTLLVRLLAAPRSPSTLGASPAQVPVQFDALLARLTAETRYGGGPSEPDDAGPPSNAPDAPDTPDARSSDVRRTLWLRHSLLRLLLDEPVVHHDDLTAEQRRYAATPTGRQLIRRAVAQAGFVLEERAEGLLLIDPDALATDATFPDSGSTAKVAALLLLDHLVGTGRPVRLDELAVVTADVLRRFPSWARAYREEHGPDRLAHEAIAVLQAFRLVRCDDVGHGVGDGLVHALPVAARYAVSVASDPVAAERNSARQVSP